MKKIFCLLLALMMTISANAQCVNAETDTTTYIGVEFYPDAPLFIYGGGNLSDNIKFDLFSNFGSEMAITVGPIIGPFAIGVGASMGMIDDKNDVSYLNADLAFKFKLKGLTWKTYTLYRLSLDDSVENKLISRQWLTPSKANYGLIGDNTWVRGKTPILFWGPYYDFGKFGLTSANKFGMMFNIIGPGIWSVWIVEF
jgi:hypothetical protein